MSLVSDFHIGKYGGIEFCCSLHTDFIHSQYETNSTNAYKFACDTRTTHWHLSKQWNTCHKERSEAVSWGWKWNSIIPPICQRGKERDSRDKNGVKRRQINEQNQPKGVIKTQKKEERMHENRIGCTHTIHNNRRTNKEQSIQNIGGKRCLFVVQHFSVIVLVSIYVIKQLNFIILFRIR